MLNQNIEFGKCNKMNLDRAELLGCCRYFKGEKENPYAPSIGFFLWEVEHDWVEREIADAQTETLSDKSSDDLNEFREAGLIDFEKSDGVWVGLKASLYRLLQHWNEGHASLKDWVRFYGDWKGSRL
ncbi:MAG: hypothetical protein HDS83_04895 [Bacteroidales bacterium]|nr:hypothetical protein [Bacteroidales bacterium]